LTNIAEKKQLFHWLIHKVSMEGKNNRFYKKFPSYVKIATSCCTHPFYTQLTCVDPKKNKKQETGKKKLQKDLCGKMQH